MAEQTKVEFPASLMLRDTGWRDDRGGSGQRIYTTAGQGYEKVRYVRADTVAELVEAVEFSIATDERYRLGGAAHDRLKAALAAVRGGAK